MAVRPILKDPDPFLRKKTRKVKDFGPKTQENIQDILDTLDVARDPEGTGLSANQIGIPEQICVIRDFSIEIEEKAKEGFQKEMEKKGAKESRPFPREELFKETIMINPKIISTSRREALDWEGCLSITDTYGKVRRPVKVKVKYQTPAGQREQMTAKGLLARIIQHEVDHLNGILFTDKVEGKTVSEDYFY